MQKRDLNYIAGILLSVVFIGMLITGLIQLKLELHRFIYHIWGAYLLIILATIHVFTNWKKLSGLIRERSRLKKEHIISIALIFSVIFTFVTGFVQVKLNFPRSRFVYHIYGAYLTLILALIHIYFNLSKVKAYLLQRKKLAGILGGVLIIACSVLGIKLFEGSKNMKNTPRAQFDLALEYHQKTKHTYAEVMRRTGGLDWAKQPAVFKEYPKAELISLPSDFDFYGISVEETIEMGPFMGNFSGEPITKQEISRLLYYTNGITGVLRYPGLTYYLRAAPSAGALYPTVIYLVVNNVEGLKKGIYHYSVKDHGLYFLKEGDFTKEVAAFVSNTSSIKNSNVVFIMSTIFYRTKWKYRERGYRYVLLDTGHVGGNLTLIARALDLGSYSMGTFLDDKINQLLEIDGLKEAAVYINAVGKIAASEQKEGMKTQIALFKKGHSEKPPKDLTIAQLLHELYLVVNNVEGIVWGIYHYNPTEHALELLKEGDYRFRIANACLGQELVGNANVAIIKTAVFERVKRDGDRGYRYIHLDAGAIGENIYLEAVSMGLGVCGIGAFFDDQINEMLDLDGIRETVIYVTSVGRV